MVDTKPNKCKIMDYDYRITHNGFVEKVLENFNKMQLVPTTKYSTTFTKILIGFLNMGDLEQGMDIHQSII